MVSIFIGLLLLGSVATPALAQNTEETGLVTCETFEDCNWPAFLKLLSNIFNALVKLGVPVATLLIVTAGIMFVIYPNNPARISTARYMLWSSVVGLVIILSSYILVKTILDFFIDTSRFPVNL